MNADITKMNQKQCAIEEISWPLAILMGIGGNGISSLFFSLM
uniref:Uncharacterized protein n=1 Tax=Rhizophora mucronata TaxID=61149 RepID=A0A2P2PND0_RHIMU